MKKLAIILWRISQVCLAVLAVLFVRHLIERDDKYSMIGLACAVGYVILTPLSLYVGYKAYKKEL